MNNSNNKDSQASSSQEIERSDDWFTRYWHLALFPTFVFAAGIHWGIITWNPGTLGFVFALVLVYFTSQVENAKLGKAMTFIVPIVFLVFTIVFPFPSGEVHNPHLDTPKLIGRASVSAIFGILLLLGTVGLVKIAQRQAHSQLQDKRAHNSQLVSAGGTMSFNDWFNEWYREQRFATMLIFFFTVAAIQFLGDTLWPPFDMKVAVVVGLIISWVIFYIIYKMQNSE